MLSLKRIGCVMAIGYLGLFGLALEIVIRSV